MGIGGAFTGCGPAFVDPRKVKYGVPRKQAYGNGISDDNWKCQIALIFSEHPGVLKDNVCSPAGTTIYVCRNQGWIY